MVKLASRYGLMYEVDIQGWGKYYGDYSDIQLYNTMHPPQVWIYYHNAHGSTYTK